MNAASVAILDPALGAAHSQADASGQLQSRGCKAQTMNGPTFADRTSPGEVPRAGRLTVADLHRATPIRLWGGKGCGAPCDFCRVLVSTAEIEYEVEAKLDGAPITLHFHPRCHDAWKVETEVPPPAEQPQVKSPI
jgi:hypothetical protein